MGETVNPVVDKLVAAKLIFWDFDGVIKDSLEAKSSAFEELFLPYGVDVARRVRVHHESNGGVSRFHKIPIYLNWSGIAPVGAVVDEFCSRFSELVLSRVLESPWVSGVREYLEANHKCQFFVLLSATPQNEIEIIASKLGIGRVFQHIFGAPIKKIDAIAQVLAATATEARDSLMVGDSEEDLIAAKGNGIRFMLRRTALNRGIQERMKFDMFDDLSS